MTFLYMFIHTDLPAQDKGLTISMKNSTLKEYVEYIEKNTDYVFMFNDDIDFSVRKTLSVTDKDMEYVLERLFAGTGITYTVSGRQISLKKEAARQQKVQ